jgi:hypothetical protein
MRIVSFAIGTIHRWLTDSNRALLLKFARELDVDGIEITLGREEDVYGLNLSKSDVSYLRGLKYVSIHAPFKLIRNKKSDEDVERILDIVEDTYRKVNAKAVVFHPLDIPEASALRKYNFNVITENMPPNWRVYSNLDMESVFRKYPKIGLCLDVSHAYRLSKGETENIVNNFRDKIRQVHLSGTYLGRDHLSLTKVTDDFMKSIEIVKTLDVPIIIEEGFEKGDMKAIKNEIELVKNLFLQ